MQTRIKTPTELEAMRVSGQMLATVLEVLTAKASVGMTSKDFADLAK